MNIESETLKWKNNLSLIIVLAKMHGDIVVLKEKVKSLFDLWNTKNK